MLPQVLLVCPATDLREGSLKGTLRVILALAQHYHPMSIRHSVKGGRNRILESSGRDSVASTPHRSTYSPVQVAISAEESLSQDMCGLQGGLPLHHNLLPGGGARRPPLIPPQYAPVKRCEAEDECTIARSSDTPSPDLGGVSPLPSTSSFAPVHRSYAMARDTPISGTRDGLVTNEGRAYSLTFGLRLHRGEWSHALHGEHDITPGNREQW